MMSRRSIATPCPVVENRQTLFLDSPQDQTTTNLDYTTAFHASFRDTKPRRRQNAASQPAVFVIHEDVSLQEAETLARSTLAQPAKRKQMSHSARGSINGEVQVTATSSKGVPNTTQVSDLQTKKPSQFRSRIGPRPSIAPWGMVNVDKPESPQHFSPKRSRPARRGTLYIPNEDTTMPSMYMGIFSPVKRVENPQQHENSILEVTGLAAQMAEKRKSRKSILAGAPKRGPLQVTVCKSQETVHVEDRFGKGDGKENIPPGCEQKPYKEHTEMKKIAQTQLAQTSKQSSVAHQSLTANRLNLSSAPSVSSRPNRTTIPEQHEKAADVKQNRPAWNSGPRSQPARISSLPPRQRLLPNSPSTSSTPDLVEPRVATRFCLPKIQHPSVSEHYEILSNNINNPAMYEEDWLAHQEIAITQLINNLFTGSHSHSATDQNSLSAKSSLIARYNSPEMGVLHSRIHASILYGSLSIPNDTLDHAPGLYSDLGRRKNFTDFWIESCSAEALKLALEIVIGRAVDHSTSTSDQNHMISTQGKSLRRYLEIFLIRNQDSHPPQDHPNAAVWSYQRTLLRSLMLIKMLDALKSRGYNHSSTCLFLTTSKIKSSVAMVQALIRTLNPAIGDAVRALKLLGYEVHYEDQALQDFDYSIVNLAADLRNGVRLTRAVELLLYPSSSRELDQCHESDATTILMPEGETINIRDRQEWPLTRHLKFPCIGRATKLWNVQIALGALSNVKEMQVIMESITPTDIVDGHREKTIRLLWGLVGRWGLPGLLDWTDVKSEIRRLRRVSQDMSDCFEDVDDSGDNSIGTCRALLERWARTVAQAHGVKIHNFTTSFSDGSAFEAIVDEYQPYLLPESDQRVLSLEDRLARVGCSRSFTQLFAARNSGQLHVFDKNFVFATLTFLCSRLLVPTKTSRAATVIQRAWRQRWTCIEAQRKKKKADVARACMDVCHVKSGQSLHQEVGMSSSMSAIQLESLNDVWLSL